MSHRARFLGLLILCPALVIGQETTGDLRGRLRTPAGGPLPGATITASSTDLIGLRRALSADDGVYQLLGLPPGIYTMSIKAIGFQPVTIEGVRVQLGRTQGLPDTQLEAVAVELAEIRIVAPKVTLDPARTTIGATLEPTDFATLPSERDYKSLLSILAHVNVSYHGDPVNVGGSTGLENMYFIDGVNVTSPLNAATGTSLPYNFIRSVEVRAGGYEAQYGRALGAIVNAITYTGTNQFESNVFGFATHDALSATPRAEPSLRETGSFSYDVGLRLSGPVMRDRLWFSTAYNARVEEAHRAIGSLGVFTDHRLADIVAGKLTWQATPAMNVELSVFGDPTNHRQVIDPMPGFVPLNPDAYLVRKETGGTTVATRITWEPGPLFRLEVSGSRFPQPRARIPHD